MANYDINDALAHAVTVVDRLCNTVIRTHFSPADPDSEFHWETICDHTVRKDLYQKVTTWLIQDSPIDLQDKHQALSAVVDNVCAQMERSAWLWNPTISGGAKNHTSEELHRAEQLDMCMNSDYLFYAAQDRLKLYQEIVASPTPKVKM